MIIASPSASLAHLQRRAGELGGNVLFTGTMLPAVYRTAVRYGIDPTVLVAQSAKETGWGQFGGVLTSDWNNTCGLKTRDGGGNYEPDAHQRFESWDQGALAHAQHLYAYSGGIVPEADLVDPRYVWVVGRHELTRMRELGGKWAPASNYGTTLETMARRLLEGA